MEADDITAPELRAALERGERPVIYDVRRPEDREWTIPGAIGLDVHDQLWANDPNALKGFHPPADRPVVFVCNRGNTSLLATSLARQQGIAATSLFGGMKAWSAQWNTAPVPASGIHAEIIQVRRTGKGCLSYVIGSHGVAAVIDAAVDPGVYLGLAEQHGWKITHVIDTHVHADHVSRARPLATASGAEVCLPDQKRVTYPFRALADGATLKIGESTLELSATPGHTFESACLLLDCRVLFTGDTLFVAGVGRPDLAAKADEETRQRARLLHASLRRIAKLPADTIVLPGHSSHPVPFDRYPVSATLGEALARAGTADLEESAFVDAVLSNMPQPPANHLKIVAANEQGIFPPETADLEVGGNRCAVGRRGGG
jgi:glyoxylase-like metal-dependent hydrolase (beta-lactamase superfamily II)/rhodanese-related sulfurtransferase